MNLSYYMIKDSMFGVKNCIISFLLLVGFAACQQETLVEATKGGFKVSLVDEQVMVETKATSSLLESPLVENFNLRIERNGSDQPLYNGKITNDLIPAPVGVYTLTASYGENPVLGLDAPYYEGKSEVTIESNKTTPVEIPCKVANALVSVDWANEAKIQKIFPGCKVIVAVGNVSVAIGSENKASRVYFRPNSNLSFTFEWTVNGETKSQVLKSDKLPAVSEAGKHYIIKLDVSDDLTLQITKVASRSETITATIPMEWLPKPKVNGFNDQQGLTELVYTETSDAIPAAINFTAASVIQDVEFTLNFADENLTSLNKKYILSTLSAEDRSALVTAGIELPTLIGSNKSGSINFTNMTAKLLTNAGAEVVNEIKVRVKANNRWNVEESAAPSYKITTVKPEFSVSVKPGNIWTREFTVDPLSFSQVPSGDFTKINKQLQYQYRSSDSQGWKIIENPDLRQMNLEENKLYYVRALYRGVVPGKSIEVKTYPQIVLNGGDMESWLEISKKLHPGINIFKEITIVGHNPSNTIWSCVNQKTFEGNPNVWSTFNLNPSTYRQEGRTGFAAALRTVGWDNNAGNTSSIIYHISAGKLFIGSYSYDHKKNVDSYNYGISYQSKPTGFKAYYKYSPYNNDSFKAWIVLENRESGQPVRIGYGEFLGTKKVDTYFEELNVPIVYENTNLPITHMYIVFSSSSACSDQESEETTNLKGFVSEGNYHNGSVLVIDDVTLEYNK